jgi:hypothetical protein
MDDVVAVELVRPPLRHYYITWGRIFDPASAEAELLAMVASSMPSVGPGDGRICSLLREAAEAPYFYEALISFGRRPIPLGDAYESWQEERRDAMRRGKEIYYLGSVPMTDGERSASSES